MAWIIENEADSELAWSNAHGWCSETFDTFTNEEHESLALPMGGRWVEVPWREPEQPQGESPAQGAHTPEFCYVARYEHGHGLDVRVFKSEESAWKWADEIAREWWEHEFGPDPVPAEKPGEAYFEAMQNRMLDDPEFFSVERAEVEP